MENIDKNTAVTHSVKTRRASALEAVELAVRFQRCQQDVDEPQGDEQEEGDELGCPWSPQLSGRHAGTPAVEQHEHAHQGHDGEEGDREGQGARVHLEWFAFAVPVNGGDGPRHANAQEHVHRVAARHVADGGVGVLVLDGGDFAGECVCRQMHSDTEEEA